MNAYEQKLEARRARLLALAEKLEAAGNARFNRARALASVIPFGQPILVGHYSEGRDRRYRARINDNYGKAFAELDAAKDARGRADSVGSGGISSEDPDAIDKLSKQLAIVERNSAHMRACNAAIRKNAKAGADAQVAALVALGVGEALAYSLLKPDFCGRIGFADYQLSNNNANGRRIKARIEQLGRMKAAPVVERESADSGIRLEDDPPGNRVRLFFPGKPEADVRSKLKGSGFRWAPSLGCWQAYRNWRAMEVAKEFVK